MKKSILILKLYLHTLFTLIKTTRHITLHFHKENCDLEMEKNNTTTKHAQYNCFQVSVSTKIEKKAFLVNNALYHLQALKLKINGQWPPTTVGEVVHG